MIIDCISDLHGFYPKLDGGDLLIVAGDLTARDTEKDWIDFEIWINQQRHKEKIIIAGNHDNFLNTMNEHCMWKYWEKVGINYLCDSGTEFERLKIWGSPWTKTFPGMNPHCKAFTCDTEEELAVKFSLIPDDIDILITHSPPFGVLDENTEKENCGSGALSLAIMNRPSIMIHIFGHIHEGYGKSKLSADKINEHRRIFINASIMNERYQPVNKPIRIEI